jgi:hypothetical protein
LDRLIRAIKKNVVPTCGLALVVAATGCTGFFVNQPNSVSVSPTTLTVAQGQKGNLTASASYNSGSKDVTKSASWSSSSPCATVNAGVVTGVGPATNVTVTANVAGTGSQSLSISPANQTFTLSTTPTTQFTATQNGTDVTNSATWTSGNTSIVTFSSTPGLATFVAAGTTSVTASISSSSSCASGSTNVTVQ